MTVYDFLTDLYNDELSDVFLGNRNSREEARPKLLPLINNGLVYAYAKYQIKLASTLLNVSKSVFTYTLPGTNILQITRVVNAYGRELSANEVQILNKTLRFHCPADTQLDVEYRVKPSRMVLTQDDTLTYVELPDLLIPWLRAYVASRVFMAQKTEAGILKGKLLHDQARMLEEDYASTNTTNEYTLSDHCRLNARGFM